MALATQHFIEIDEEIGRLFRHEDVKHIEVCIAKEARVSPFVLASLLLNPCDVNVRYGELTMSISFSASLSFSSRNRFGTVILTVPSRSGLPALGVYALTNSS